MFYEGDHSTLLKREEQKQYKKAYHIHNGRLYHYAKCETLWSILASDCFFARNIRFSNDSNEYMTGRACLEDFINGMTELSDEEKKQIRIQIFENPMMYFMVCFCQDGDLLSQWRGYAQNGVSLGLDFTSGYTSQEKIEQHVEYFCVLNNKNYQDKYKDDKGKFFINNKSVSFVQSPYQVQYIPKNKTDLENQQKWDKIKSVLQELWGTGENEERISRLMRYIPFVKDDGFSEEAEYRLIFDMEYLGESKAYSNYVRSKKMEYLDSEHIKKPYIVVKFGNPKDKMEAVKKIRIGKNIEQILDVLKQEIRDALFVLDADCEDIYIGEGNNQEEILLKIEKTLEQPFVTEEQMKNIKIWCEGHLPIREIIVGPNKNQEEMIESLEHYKKTIYWLRYIDINKSKIPLRN